MGNIHRFHDLRCETCTDNECFWRERDINGLTTMKGCASHSNVDTIKRKKEM